MTVSSLFASKEINPLGDVPVVSVDHATLFSELAVQDFKGRMKPMHTLSRELTRKLFRSENFHGLSADQVVLSMFGDQAKWAKMPLIKLGKHPALASEFDLTGEFAQFEDFFDLRGSLWTIRREECHGDERSLSDFYR